MSLLEHAIFGNRDGSHQLLQTTLFGQESLLEEVRFLVDRPAGQIGPEIIWSPYWGCGPVRDWWVLWRGAEDTAAPRRNMVRSHVVMIRQQHVDSINDMEALLNLFAFYPGAGERDIGAVVLNALSYGKRPVVIPDISVVPNVLAALWPRLWPAARRCFSMRTLFGSESLEFGGGPAPHVVVIPSELRPRWQTYEPMDGHSTMEIQGAGVSGLDRLVSENWDRLPGDFAILPRLRRIADAFSAVQRDPGLPADGLLIIRTAEALGFELALPKADLDLLVKNLSDLRNASVADIRTASLVSLSLIGQALPTVERSVSAWVEEKLPAESDTEALWILEQQSRRVHAKWWVKAIQVGITVGCEKMSEEWATSLWRWWAVNVQAVDWIRGLLPHNSKTELSLLLHLPSEIPEALRISVRDLCAQRQWARLLAGALRGTRRLSDTVKVLRELMDHPINGLDVLLEGSVPADIVEAAVISGWDPLIERAASHTVGNVELLEGVRSDSLGFLPLLNRHLTAGGALPSMARNPVFITMLFDGCIGNDKDCVEIVYHVGATAAVVALDYDRQNDLWSYLHRECRESLLSATANAWLRAYMDGKNPDHPGPILADVVQRMARSRITAGSARWVVGVLAAFPEIGEQDAISWLVSDRFSWSDQDAETLGGLLIQRGWRLAVRRFAQSRREPLKAAAWQARHLLNRWDRLSLFPPDVPEDISATREHHDKERGRSTMKVLFLAANPMTSNRLAIDQEARSIEEKVRASKYRDSIVVQTKWAVRPHDLQQVLLEEQPTVVHFSGHGSGVHGVVLHSEIDGEETLVSSEALAHLFKVLRDNIRVVVLNACYSREQANHIVKEIDFVVGMDDSIGDDAAREFAAAFYGGLGFGRSVQTAFDLGLNALQLMNMKADAKVPALLTRCGVDAESVSLVRTTKP